MYIVVIQCLNDPVDPESCLDPRDLNRDLNPVCVLLSCMIIVMFFVMSESS